jgi:ribosomal protein L19
MYQVHKEFYEAFQGTLLSRKEALQGSSFLLTR